MSLAIEITRPPLNGSLLRDGESLSYTYTPDANFVGTDFFQWQATDTETGKKSNISTVKVRVVDSSVQNWCPFAPTEDIQVGYYQLTTAERNVLLLDFILRAFNFVDRDPSYGVLGQTSSVGVVLYAQKDSVLTPVWPEVYYLTADNPTLTVGNIQHLLPTESALILRVVSVEGQAQGLCLETRVTPVPDNELTLYPPNNFTLDEQVT